MSNLTLGDLSITGLTDIKSFTIPAKTLFPDFNDSLVKSLEPSEQLIVSRGSNKSYNQIMVTSTIWSKYFDRQLCRSR